MIENDKITKAAFSLFTLLSIIVILFYVFENAKLEYKLSIKNKNEDVTFLKQEVIKWKRDSDFWFKRYESMSTAYSYLELAHDELKKDKTSVCPKCFKHWNNK